MTPHLAHFLMGIIIMSNREYAHDQIGVKNIPNSHFSLSTEKFLKPGRLTP
jgi:hypothetical protein